MLYSKANKGFTFILKWLSWKPQPWMNTAEVKLSKPGGPISPHEQLLGKELSIFCSISTDAEGPKYCCMPHSQSSTPSKLHTSPSATPLAPSFRTNKIQYCLHVLQRNHRFHSLWSFWAATLLQSFLLSPLFVRHTHAQNPTLQPQNPWLSPFFTLWPPLLEQYPPRHQALCYSLFLQKPTQDISLLRIFQLSHIVLHFYQFVQFVCVYVCAYFA